MGLDLLSLVQAFCVLLGVGAGRRGARHSLFLLLYTHRLLDTGLAWFPDCLIMLSSVMRPVTHYSDKCVLQYLRPLLCGDAFAGYSPKI